MSHIGDVGDLAEGNESLLSLGLSTNAREFSMCDESVTLNNGEVQSRSFDPSIVPNSARSLNTTSTDCSEEATENQKPNQQNHLKNKSSLNDDVICLDDHVNEDIISGRLEGGGFIVNGFVELDNRTINSDTDMINIESEDEDINYTPSQQLLDDSIVFVNCVKDQGLVPRVFKGYIKEFIEDRPNRLGILYSQECGKLHNV